MQNPTKKRVQTRTLNYLTVFNYASFAVIDDDKSAFLLLKSSIEIVILVCA